MRYLKTTIVFAAAIAFSGCIPLSAQTNEPDVANGGTAPVRRGGASRTEVKNFEFKGGNLHEFLNQIKTEFNIDVQARANIDSSDEYNIRVPPMRATIDSRLNSIIPGGVNGWRILELYNDISRQYPGMGKWVLVRSDLVHPSDGPNSVLFVPPAGEEGGISLSVRAFSVGGIKSVDDLLKVIDAEQDKLRNAGEKLAYDHHSSGELNEYLGGVHISEGTHILVATGGKVYVEMVSSVVEAYLKEHHLDFWGSGAPAAGTNSPAK